MGLQLPLYTAQSPALYVANIDAVAAFLAAATLNPVYNGAVQMDQRITTGAPVTINSATRIYGPDGWAGARNGSGEFTIERSTANLPTGYAAKLLATVTVADAAIAATDLYVIQFPLEGNAIRNFRIGTAAAEKIALGFWVRCSMTGTFGISLQNHTPNRSYIGVFTVNLADTWEWKSLILTADTTGTWNWDANHGMSISFCLGAGTNSQGAAGSWLAQNQYTTAAQTQWISTGGATFAVTGLRAQIAEALATDLGYAYLPPALLQEIAERYYHKTYALATAPGAATALGAVNGEGASTTDVTVNARFPRMRAAPTVSVYAGTSGTANKVRQWGGGDIGTNVVAANSSEDAILNLNDGAAPFVAGTKYYFHLVRRAEF